MKQTLHFISSRLYKFFVVGAWVISLSLVSCVDHDYDLSKDIDLTFKLGGDSISGPVGNTDSIFLSKMLKVDESELLHTDQNKYYLEKDGGYQKISVTVDKIKYNPNFSAPSYTQTVVSKGSSIYSGTFPFSVNKVLSDQSMSLGLTGVSSEITFLRRLSLENTVATVTVKVNDASGTVALTHLSNFKITFPDFIVSSDLTNHQLTVDGDVTGSAITRSINVQAIDFGADVENSGGTINFDGGTIILNGNFTVKSNKTVASMPNDVNFSFSMNISQSTISSVVGKFDPNIDKKVFSVALNDLPDWLQDENVRLDIYNPEIKLDVVNPLAIPFVVSNATIDGSQSVAIPSMVFDAAKHSMNYITRQGVLDFDPSPTPADVYHMNKVENLSNVILKIPKQIGITIPNIKMDCSEDRTFNLGETYTLNMHYQVLIPFTFGGEFNIVYNDTITDLHKNLKNVDASEVSVTGIVDTDIPLDMTLSVKPVDAQGNDLSEYLTINVTQTISGGGGSTNSVASTPVTILINEKKSGTIKDNLDAIILKIGAASSSTKAGKSLCSNQFLLMRNIKAKIIGGVTVDAN
jgi:hypothetical protein